MRWTDFSPPYHRKAIIQHPVFASTPILNYNVTDREHLDMNTVPFGVEPWRWLNGIQILIEYCMYYHVQYFMFIKFFCAIFGQLAKHPVTEK